MLDTDELRAEIEAEFTRQLAPELAAMGANQVYVLWNSECRHPGRWLGLYHCWFAGWYRQVIGSRWKGPGPCWILHDREFGQKAKGDGYVFEEMSWNVSTHEAAHAVLIPTLMVGLEDASSACKAIMRQVVKQTSKRQKGKSVAHRWVENATDGSHGADFARVATHLAWRVADHRGGISVNVHDPVEGAIIGLLEATFEIRSELKSMRAVPISEVAKSPVPEALTRRYQQRLKERGVEMWITKQAASVAGE
jgi:hypothetical protein